MDSKLVCMYYCFIVFILVLANEVGGQLEGRVFDVTNFGAVGDGKSDNTKPFRDAFANACSYTSGSSMMLIPKGTFMVKSAVFKGPCKGPIEFRLEGTIKAPADLVGDDKWVAFRYFNGLSITGGGTFDGSGETAWHNKHCRKNSKCLPVSIRLEFVDNAVVSGISSLNGKFFHMSIYKSSNIELDGITITAPADSPNTDGVHISNSYNIRILNSNIATGDDCISLGAANKNIFISKVKCGPGHGISIGSLGKYEGDTDVSGVTVQHCTLTRTQNGLRIKTWGSDIKLKVYNITYDDVIMDDVYNPILIDQKYCPSGDCDKSKVSSVQIQDVWFSNVRGSSKSEYAVKFLCSSEYPCNNINIRDINLLYQGPEGPAKSSCSNVRGSASATQNPHPCILESSSLACPITSSSWISLIPIGLVWLAQ
ncbi:hypothetical protein SAY87_029714 [Trapa incisa]|uniref:Polygalacturonase n=1 Tax=Trapa incisa TaxID=236973 RepID=A0AAN7KFC1_9MYRT|nr:hypothetical protein SAY87_029714 [Trapa incisa]